MRYFFPLFFLLLSSCFSIPIYNTYFQNSPVEQKEICSPMKKDGEIPLPFPLKKDKTVDHKRI